MAHKKQAQIPVKRTRSASKPVTLKSGSTGEGVSSRRTSRQVHNSDREGAQRAYNASKDLKGVVEEPTFMYTSKIRAIGNSQGVILNSQLMEAAGFEQEADVTIKAGNGVIIIVQDQPDNINTDLSTWDRQFKLAINNGAAPEGDMFEGLANDFDEKEW